MHQTAAITGPKAGKRESQTSETEARSFQLDAQHHCSIRGGEPPPESALGCSWWQATSSLLPRGPDRAKRQPASVDRVLSTIAIPEKANLLRKALRAALGGKLQVAGYREDPTG